VDASDRQKILEVLFWMADRPLKITDLQNILEADCPSELELREELAAFGRVLDERLSPVQLAEVAQGFQVTSRPAYSPWIRKLFKNKTTLRLSPSALETLSIIAYKQPLTRSEIEEIRGVDAGGVLETLLEYKMIKILGRKEALGRPLLYGTTMDFMRQFGLKSLDELPRLEELVPSDDPLPTPEPEHA
jgi:segregation and condensation protein B